MSYTEPPFDRWSVTRWDQEKVGGRETRLNRIWAAKSMGVLAEGREEDEESDRRTPARSVFCCGFLTTTAAFHPAYVDQIRKGQPNIARLVVGTSVLVWSSPNKPLILAPRNLNSAPASNAAFIVPPLSDN